MALHLVTGGEGFIGSRLVEKLIKSGENVRVIDLLPSSKENTHHEHIQGSLLNPSLVQKAVSNVEYVHHVAAAVPLWASEEAYKNSNVLGTRILLESVLKEKTFKHFNYVSSSAVYGKTTLADCPINESRRPNPFEAYGKSKRAAESLVEDLLQNSTATYSILRPRTVLGRARIGIFELLFNWISYNSTIYTIGNGNNKLQLIHVDDLANACLLAQKKRAHGIFNLGAENFGTINELMTNLCRRVESSSKILNVPALPAVIGLYLLDKTKLSPFQPWHYQTFHLDNYFDISKAKRELGWEPEYSNDEMIFESYKYYLENRGKKLDENSIHKRTLNRKILKFFMR